MRKSYFREDFPYFKENFLLKLGRCTKVSNSQPAPFADNVINLIQYLETPGSNSRHVDKCCTARFRYLAIWSLCCSTTTAYYISLLLALIIIIIIIAFSFNVFQDSLSCLLCLKCSHLIAYLPFESQSFVSLSMLSATAIINETYLFWGYRHIGGLHNCAPPSKIMDPLCQ